MSQSLKPHSINLSESEEARLRMVMSHGVTIVGIFRMGLSSYENSLLAKAKMNEIREAVIPQVVMPDQAV